MPSLVEVSLREEKAAPAASGQNRFDRGRAEIQGVLDVERTLCADDLLIPRAGSQVAQAPPPGPVSRHEDVRAEGLRGAPVVS